MSGIRMTRTFVTICVLGSLCWASIPGWKSGEVSEELRKKLGKTQGSDPLIRPWDNPDLEYLLANDYKDYLESERAVASSKKPNIEETTTTRPTETSTTTESSTEASFELTNEEISDSVIEEDKLPSDEQTRGEKVVKHTENTEVKAGNSSQVNEDYDEFMKDLLTINSTKSQKSAIQPIEKNTKADVLPSLEESINPNANKLTSEMHNATTPPPLSDMFSEKFTTIAKANLSVDPFQEEKPQTDDCLPISYRLKGIRSLIPPDLLYELAISPIGSYILFASNNFPLEQIKPKENKAILANGLPIKILLREILKLLPIDVHGTNPIVAPKSLEKTIDGRLQGFLQIVEEAETRQLTWTRVSLEEFMDLSRKASVFIQTGEPGSVTSILLKRGPVSPSPATSNSDAPKQPQIFNQTLMDNLKELEVLRDKLKQIKVE